MRINIGSKNIVKINAVKECLKDYKILSNLIFESFDVDSDVSEQPKSMKETIKGAMNRARKAFKGCDLSFGIEDGLMKVPYTKTGFMNICVCTIFDGKKFHVGFSSAFEYPILATKLVFDEGLDINQAFNRLGLSKNPKLGSAEGAIGILTKGRELRIDYTKQAVRNAMIHLENKELY